MRQSQIFGKTLREDPKGEVAANARLLERGGFVYKSMAGVYEYLPLGYRVLEKINGIIREEMNAIGGQCLFLSALQPKERWEKTGRWEGMRDIMYQFKDHSRREIGLATTHEEVITEIAIRFIQSYKDLPLFLYQIQTKFRDEPRAKSGLIRGREFLMKDLYSFHTDGKDLDKFYKIADKAYMKIFKRCGLNAYLTEAGGGTFTKEFTHEYQVLSDAGEDVIYYCGKCRFAQNKEITLLKEGDKCSKCGGIISVGKSIEVGNIFKLGTKFSEAFGLHYSDKEGNKKPVVMGSYGTGPGRLMATIVEAFHDDKGIIWKESVAPFKIHLLLIAAAKSEKFKSLKRYAENIYKELLAKGIEVLYDDRDEKTPGEKFADADLIGIPWRVVVSEKTMQQKGLEVKRRNSKKSKIVTQIEFLRGLRFRV